MKPYPRTWLPTIALIGALAACGSPAATQPTQPAATAQPAATTAPTVAPTAPATAAPQPTAEPTTIAAPSATPAPTYLLPNDMPWVYSGGTIFADDESFELAKHGLPPPAYNFATAPNGGMVAYTSQQGHLVVADVRTSQAIVDDSQSVMATSFVFAPDSRALAYGTSEGELYTIELPGGTRRPIPLAQQPVPQNAPASALMPLSWTQDGLYAQQVIWGSDAPPQGIVRVDPASGAITPVSGKEMISAAFAPDGKSIALITGSMPLGGEPNTGIALLDLASGQRTQLVAERPQIIRGLSWSPDGTRLLYAVGDTYESNDTRLHVLTPGGPASAPGEGLAIQLYRDIGWLDSTTPIVLTVKPSGVWLYRMELGDQGPNSPTPLMGIPAQPGAQVDGQLIYTPRGAS